MTPYDRIDFRIVVGVSSEHAYPYHRFLQIVSLTPQSHLDKEREQFYKPRAINESLSISDTCNRIPDFGVTDFNGRFSQIG